MAPPPPMCLPFTSKPRRRLSWSSAAPPPTSPRDTMARRPSESPTPTVHDDDRDDDDRLTFLTDSEKWDVPQTLPEFSPKGKPSLKRSNTMTGTKKSTKSTGGSSKWGYGWGVGKKQKEKEIEAAQGSSMGSSQTNLPLYEPPIIPSSNPPTRSNSQSTTASRSTQRTQASQLSQRSQASFPKPDLQRNDSQRSQRSQRSQASASTVRTGTSKGLPPLPGAMPGSMPGSVPGSPRSPRPQLYANDSTSTLVGSALERKMNEVDSVRDLSDTAERLEDMRKLMANQTLDYYVVPNEDSHGSEIVADSDQRRQFISLFYGSSGDAIISMEKAYLFVDARYWLQAKQSLDRNWTVVRAGDVGQPKDWMEWIVGRANGSRIGIDARMISHDKAQLLTSKLEKTSKLVFPTQNLIDLVWKEKPQKSKAPIYLQPIEFAGVSANTKLMKLREWIRQQPPTVPSYSKSAPTAQQMQVGTLISSLSAIAYLLNIRGSDVPHNPLFHAYLYVGLEKAVIFLDASKIVPETADYLKGLGVERKEYLELWPFLRQREWGEGKILISPETSYAISLMLTHYRYTVSPAYVDSMMSVKNETELEGLRRAYLRDGASFVRFLAWLENKLQDGYDITEWEAASRLTEFRRHGKHFMGIAYKSISASGPNAALPHYTPRKATASMIDRETPYLNDSGGQYRDGTCDTTRTVHFGRPTADMCEAYTRVLQGHIAIDSAVFPEGTSGRSLDVLARKALWKEGLNYMHGTGHGFGSFLTVHEGPQSFSSDTALVPGHVITNEPGFYLEGKWGMRIESALAVRRVRTKNEFNGAIWLGFERLTCVPIQTRMVKESMLTKEEKAWLKDHNQRCWEKLQSHLQDDKRALKWLKREADRGIGLAQGPGGINIDWD